MIDKDITMQSEGTEEVATCPGTPSSDKMTFIKSTAIIASDVSPKIDQTEAISPAKFSNINLEDDIEKVEVDSHESSESENDHSEDKPEFIPIPDFSTIPQENPNESIKNWLQKITEIQNVVSKKSTVTSSTSNAIPTAPRVVNYQDLPYMGEITLDNSKPRRGRKPKKADICHLIYKNYGTIFPGTPNANSYLEKDSCHAANKKNAGVVKDTDVGRNDVQNKIISSLLEKRLTQENKKSLKAKKATDQNEPLNLCIRDLNHLKIRLNKNEKLLVPEIKSEPPSDDDIEIVNETPSPSLSVKTEVRFPSVTPDSLSTSSPDIPNTPDGQVGPGGCVYWPNAGIFIHPMALQQQLLMYQRLAGNMNYPLPSHSPRPPPAASTDTKPEHSEHLRKIVPKIPKTHSATEPSHHSKPKRNATSGSNDKTPTKRKRSAIFIPPIPAESTTNPTTEVSICKFKFTGGAKPSLQEKKMLSVDSGGNFRYYSGTGDKSMRGYEFFPRETLQQQINAQGSSTEAFLQASGEKIYPAPPLEITGGNSTSDFLLQPNLPGSSIAAIQQEVNNGNAAAATSVIRNKKRKTRKSVQREKLEQTFKEKGFLIQTQQLESAEGATYCKFRQLRKFTRYLFRSWKDYLPGNVKELSETEQRELQQAGISEIPADTVDDSVPAQLEETTGSS